MDKHVVIIADADGVIRLWSGGATAAFGHDAAAAIGQSLDLIVPRQFAPAHWTGFRKALETGTAGLEGKLGPFPVLCANGEVAVTPGTLNLVRRADGQVIAAMVIFEV